MWMLIRFSSLQVSVGPSWQFLMGPRPLRLELQFSDFEREPNAEETETAKWEGYPSLVSKMRRELATGVDGKDYAQHGGDVVSHIAASMR